MRIYRTPDSRFDNLPGWPFQPRYLVQDDLRMHYVDAPYRSIERFADELDLHAVTLVVHDWGRSGSASRWSIRGGSTVWSC